MKYTKTLKPIQSYLPSGYRKKSVRLEVQNKVCVKCYWDGGSKITFSLNNLTSGRYIQGLGIDPWNKDPNDPKFYFEIPSDTYVLESGTFCGKPATATLIFRSEEDLKGFIEKYKLELES